VYTNGMRPRALKMATKMLGTAGEKGSAMMSW